MLVQELKTVVPLRLVHWLKNNVVLSEYMEYARAYLPDHVLWTYKWARKDKLGNVENVSTQTQVVTILQPAFYKWKSLQPRHWNYLIPKQNDQKTLPMHRNLPITADNVSWVLQAMTIIFSNQILILTYYDSFYNDDFCSGYRKANFSYLLVDNRATWVLAKEITEILKIPKSLIAENVFYWFSS